MPDLQQHFTVTLGLNSQVVDFFISRKRPPGNEYWLNQATYMSSAPGYVFIPAYFDLLIRQGIAADDLLTDKLLIPMEGVLKSAGKLEYKNITQERHLEECRSLLKSSGVSDESIAVVEQELVSRPFNGIPAKFHSLQRANTFLYTFGVGQFDFNLLFTTWELVVPLFLMLDDFSDIDKDIADNDENCLLDGQSIMENFFELTTVVEKLLSTLSALNPHLANHLRAMKNEAVARNMLVIMSKGTK